MRSLETTTRCRLAVTLFVGLLLGSCEMQGDMVYSSYDPLATGEQYADYGENPFVETSLEAVSTFSIDVDQGSYTNIRRLIDQGSRPPVEAVRIEEMINYFKYDYPAPTGSDPVAISTELTACPWEPDHRLIHIGLKAKDIPLDQLPPSNLVFLIDVSGSMNEELPLLRNAFKELANNLRDEDRIAIVSYAGSNDLVLASTPGSQRDKILTAIDNLAAGGGTNGAAGIITAYQEAERGFITEGNNRVILATDGDFNIGITDDNELIKLIESKRDLGIHLTTLGIGNGNYKEVKMEQMADRGNGNYFYLDNFAEAKRVFVGQMTGTLYLLAKDVKVQVEFDQSVVKSYRLIGYENRKLENSDFENDKKDAGDMGVGHTVTAIYEIIPQKAATLGAPTIHFNLRYKDPEGEESKLITSTLNYTPANSESTNARFASSVVEFGLILRNSKYKGSSNLGNVISRASSALGTDPGERQGFVDLVRRYEQLP
jgi:Ca-activated chloride channel homolog